MSEEQKSKHAADILKVTDNTLQGFVKGIPEPSPFHEDFQKIVFFRGEVKKVISTSGAGDTLVGATAYYLCDYYHNNSIFIHQLCVYQ